MVVMTRTMSGAGRCDAASKGTGNESNTDATPNEVARLQAGIDRLRLERSDLRACRLADREHVT